MCTSSGFEDFLLFNGDCFLFVDEAKTFDDAEAACKQRGAHLASINDAGSEFFAITTIKSEDAWIGLSNKKVPDWISKSWNWRLRCYGPYAHWLCFFAPNPNLVDNKCGF